MVDLNVLSEVGGFKHYLAKDTLGLMGVLKHPKHPLNTPLSPSPSHTHSLSLLLTCLRTHPSTHSLPPSHCHSIP